MLIIPTFSKRKLIFLCLTIFLFLTFNQYMGNQHDEIARWVILNEQVKLGTTTIIINQLDVINFDPSKQGRLGGPFPHLLEYTPRFRDFLNTLMYFYIPCPVNPDRSRVRVSAEILFDSQYGPPALNFSLQNSRENKPGHSLQGENVIFSEIVTGYIDWNQKDFLLTITDQGTGQQQSIYLKPKEWKEKHYSYGNLAPPMPPSEYCPVDPILVSFLESFEINMIYHEDKKNLPDWQNYIVPEVRNTFPWRRLYREQDGEILHLSTTGICRWEGSRPGFKRVYSYPIIYLDSKGNDLLLRQKLYFVRWKDSWRVLDVNPAQRI